MQDVPGSSILGTYNFEFHIQSPNFETRISELEPKISDFKSESSNFKIGLFLKFEI